MMELNEKIFVVVIIANILLMKLNLHILKFAVLEIGDLNLQNCKFFVI